MTSSGWTRTFLRRDIKGSTGEKTDYGFIGRTAAVLTPIDTFTPVLHATTKKSNTSSPDASYHMERVNLAFLVLLPKTKSGNEYVFMIVDQFTK
ncbi:hypothetical protein PoB_005169000 [Plakobranchus ocellatus]|uniref:Uncharacterized protein n=1 Tax=Plakobranchus ocellatus TaxID=259542 RepID=A0AAV4C1B2_9GAST|nr:hypothetical protein PoB_005169000 [Plakobranchus ocellatus]